MTLQEANDLLDNGKMVWHPLMKDKERFHRNSEGTYLMLGVWSIAFDIEDFAKELNAYDGWVEVYNHQQKEEKP